MFFKMAEERSCFPTFTESVTEEEKNLTLEDKLKLLDSEIRQLYNFCKNSGYTRAEIERCARPLFDDGAKRAKLTEWLKIFVYIAVVVGFIALLFYLDPTYRQICINGKLLAIKILPYWDWTNIYDQDCFIENPYYEGNKLTEGDCKNCKELREIRRISNASRDAISNEFLLSNIPVVVTDAVNGWEATGKFSLEFLAELYDTNSLLVASEPCRFESTEPDYKHPRDLLREVTKGAIPQDFHSYWENCAKDAAKVMRSFYKRPYFLPLMAEATEGNWLIVSHSNRKSLSVSWEGSATWMAQIKGSAKVTLKPSPTCINICQKVVVNLQPGEILTVTNEMWEVAYLPLGKEPVITLGSAVTWDV